MKLEKRKQNIYITLQGREKLWNRSLIMAFSIALLLHLAAFLLIHVTPIVTGGKEIILSPIAVNAEIPVGADVLADLKSETPSRYPFEPPRPTPLLPELPCALPTLAGLQLVEFQEPPYPFHHVPTPDLDCKDTPRALSIAVSGPLARALMIQSELPELEGNFHEKYAVRVDNRTGRVFWYQPESKAPNPPVEALLDALCFITAGDAPFTTGYIEIGARS